ncbi:hypothetical protein MHY87_00525 [Microvirga sp. ACRRW]|uniref:hypothetical protein n=1 Tax=Microvirga sp. ACRRW TaxID=2918205 RepID=UPI001EF6AED4|nr:hypothetical protein [Microvirga sp. ACRRW]MCG7391390.1 hypothetical protein [Microvirga sp. ACRRW]
MLPRIHKRLSMRGLIAAVLGIAGAGLAGCSTSADISYGSYRFGPGYESGQVYESRVFGDTQQGLGAENCRTVVRRERDAFGRLSSREETVCE